MSRFLRPLASLRLTVALLAAAMVLIFAGTLAQASMGVWQVVDTYFRSLVAWIDLQVFVPRAIAEIPVTVPFPGGLLIAGLMIVNLLAAHALRFRLQKRRIGVLILHAGIIVLLLGEFITAGFAEEGLMSIDEGGSASFVEDIREVELAFIESAGEGSTGVASIPQPLIEKAVRSGEPLEPLRMPFTAEIDRWIPNARLLHAHGETPATHGVGLEAVPDELPPVRGADGGASDAPAAYVTLRGESGEKIGTWLLFAGLIDSQPVKVNGEEYGIALRFERTYKPYTVHLIDFRHDKFTGTEIARNFASRVRLVDPERSTDREVVISMNNPLRYEGDTFYQASYKPDGSGTVLQVVRNPGATLPYIACILVGGGMLWHFALGLWGWLRRENSKLAKETESQAGETARGAKPPRLAWQRAVPWAAAAFGLFVAFSGLMRPAPESEYDIERFSALPVSAHGRVKPMDTAARHVMMMASGRQSVDSGEREVSAAEFALKLMARPESIRDLPVVRVDHPSVLALMNLEPEDGGRISLGVIEPHWQEISRQAVRAIDVEPKQRDLFQKSVLELFDRVNTLLSWSSMTAPYVIPPFVDEPEWRPFTEAFMDSQHAGPAAAPVNMSPGVAYYIAMMTAYSEDDAQTFNNAVAGYADLLSRDMPGAMRKASAEVWFNRASLFVGTMVVYVLAFLVLCASMLMRFRGGGGESLRAAAVGLLWSGFAIHTLAIVMRIWLQERPPVTNLYSSAVFVGWAAVLTALFLERYTRIGLAALSASAVGFTTLVVAHNLGSDGDTMQMMQAVLDSNFWLATHVITITLGYSAVFLAGTLATIYVLLGVFTRALTKDRARALSKMVYGVVCFALLLSFIGTVLGGIWADQSWGRFWGWDPKENGAALVVLITAIILHARWGGFIRERGIMLLAVAGNIVTAWSWFGTNMLGVGLHSYGFMDSAVFWLMLFVVSQVALILCGLTPLQAWRSNRKQREAPG